MKRLIFAFLLLGCVIPCAYGETELTQKDKADLVGEYRFEGDFKKHRDVVVELTISLDDEGNPIGHQRYTRRKMQGEWGASIFTNYRRLSRHEWIDDWKVKTLSGDRCGQDRHCFVANQAFTYKWNNEKYTKYGKRLQQFTLDYQEVQNYSVEKKGHAGGLSSPYSKVPGSGVTYVAKQSVPKVVPKAVVTPTQVVQTDEGKQLDLEFWQSIKDSGEVEMYQAYLSEFPKGKFKKLAKLKLKKLGVVPSKSAVPLLAYGRYHALVIGNNNYEHLPDLETAVGDARRIASILEYDYGFDVKLLKNATRSEIIKSLSGLRRKIRSEDNLLIYYAGHGNLDKKANEGYWLPTDAERGDPSNWIPNDTIVAQVRAMDAKHVMVVADSCFSGTITRGLKIDQRSPGWLQKIVKKKSRTALTSGGLEPVMDSGGGNHSAFAKAFISLLEENDGVLDASELFSQLRPKVMVNSPQTPEYGNIHQAGHDGGDFLFVRQ